MTPSESFLVALHAKKKIRIAYVDDEQRQVTATVAPLDYGQIDPEEPAQFSKFDFDQRGEEAWFAVLPSNVLDLEVTAESFNPADCIDWDTNEVPWMMAREW